MNFMAQPMSLLCQLVFHAGILSILFILSLLLRDFATSYLVVQILGDNELGATEIVLNIAKSQRVPD
jgi:hypothetical protein